jgi:hypothetical protein
MYPGENQVVTRDSEAHSAAAAARGSRILRRFRPSGDELTLNMDMAQ